MSATSARPSDATLSVAKAARFLGVHPNTIRAWSDEGRLRAYRINARGDRRFRSADLRQFLAGAEQVRPTGRQLHPLLPVLPSNAPGAAARIRASAAGVIGGVTADSHAPPGHAGGISQLVQLASLAGTALPLDRLLASAARTVREATGSTEVTIWERRDHDVVRRASAVLSGRRCTPTATSPALARRALSSRRPSIEVRRPARGIRGPAPRSEEIAVPVAAGEEPWGAIHVRLGRALPAGDQTIAWLEAAAGIVASAIRTTAILADAVNDVRRADALRRAATDASGAVELEDTVSRLLDHVMTLFEADHGAVLLRNGEVSMGRTIARGLLAEDLAELDNDWSMSVPARALRERRTLIERQDGRRGPGASVRRPGASSASDAPAPARVVWVAAAPLLDGDQSPGVLCLYHDRERTWTAVEIETLIAFATQVTVAIRTAEHYAQLARWAAQLQSIHQLGQRLGRLTTVPEIGQMIASELGQLIAYDNVRVYRLEGRDLNAVALQAHDTEYVDETPDAVRSRIGEGITGWVAAHGVAQNLPDTSLDPRTEDIPGSAQFDESMVLAPMIFEDRVLGVIVLVRRGLHQFSDDDLRLLEIYAGFAGQAIAGVEAAERSRDQATALGRQLRSQRELLLITESILSTLDPRAILDQIADRLGRLVRYDGIVIEQYDRRTEQLTVLTSLGAGPEREIHDPRHDAVAAWVIRHNRTRQVTGNEAPADAPDAPDASDAPDDDRLTPAASQIIAPIRGRDGVAGLLTIARTGEPGPFSPEEFELVQLFAGQVSISLQNAEVHRAAELRIAAAVSGATSEGEFQPH